MKYEVIDKIEPIEVIATGKSIREISRLNRIYGRGRWRKLKGITKVRFEDGRVCKADVRLGMKHTELEKKGLKSNKFLTNRKATEMKKFAICINNEGHEVSLERWKVYELITDEKASAYGQARVIDESGEDYLYPYDFFVRIDLPELVQEAMISERVGLSAP